MNLSNIIIGNNVISVGDYAFYNCSNLTCVTIPNSVVSVGNEVFSNCSKLTSINVSENNQNYTSIAGVLFNKDKTKLIQYPEAKTDDIYSIPDSVETIGEYAFLGCKNLTNITIPNSVTQIGRSAFNGCGKLSMVTIPDGVRSIEDYTFKSCSNLTKVTIPNGVTKIGNYAFEYCYKLNGVTIPDSVISIGNYAFYDCFHDLSTVVIGNGVTNIGEAAFRSCDYLISVVIGSSVKVIGADAFDGCTYLSTVYYNGTQAEWSRISIYSDYFLKNAQKKFFYYVTLFGENGNKIGKIINTSKTINLSGIRVPDGTSVFLYTDEKMTKPFDVNTPINENLTLFADFVKLNAIEVVGVDNVDVTGKIAQKVNFSTDKEAKYIVCTIKFSKDLILNEIKSDYFEIESNLETLGEYQHLYLYLTYNCSEFIPINHTITSFELIFDISDNAVPEDILTIEILEDAILANDSNTYSFTTIENSQIKINSILAASITIMGSDEVNCPTAYTVSVLPENTTNKNIEWSVSDETVATISQEGVLTPIKCGNVIISAMAKDGSGIIAKKTILVKLVGTVTSFSTNIGIWDNEYSSKDNSYIIYVPESTTSIRLKAEHVGTLKTKDGKTTFLNNIARIVMLSATSNETVVELEYICEGHDNNSYTLRFIKYEGTKSSVSKEGKEFNVTPINVDIGKKVILALYENGKFLEMQSSNFEGEEIVFTTTKVYTDAKVMVWDDITTLKPICDVEVVK